MIAFSSFFTPRCVEPQPSNRATQQRQSHYPTVTTPARESTMTNSRPQIPPQPPVNPPHASSLLQTTTANTLTPPSNQHNQAQRLEQAQHAWAQIFATPQNHNTNEHRSHISRPIQLTPENQLANDSWGDEMTEKPDDVTRVYAMNVNGLALDRRGGRYDTLCSTLKEVQADIFCGQEHNLDSNQTAVRATIFNTSRQHWQRSRALFATTPIEFSHAYKPGGSMIMTMDHTTGRIIRQSADKWGRWASYTYQGANNSTLSVISAYQVVPMSNSRGTATAAAQQHCLLLQNGDSITNPRKAFRRDLIAFLKQLASDGDEILLLGDFNEPLGSEADGMTLIAAELNLLDLFASHNSSTMPATYARGSSRLDYALATAKVVASVRSAGYEPFNNRFPTDHRAYFIDFDSTRLFGSNTQHLSRIEPRVLKSQNVNQVTEYIQKKYDLLLQHNAFDRAERLTLPGNRDAFAERLDRDVLQASLSAEKACRRYGQPSWSVELSKARQKVVFLQKCLSMAKTGLTHIAILQRMVDKNPLEFTIPNDEKACNMALRATKKKIREIVSQSFEQREIERERRIKDLEASATKADKSKAKILRRLRKAEAIKQLFKKLKAVRTSTVQPGVTRLEIPVHPTIDPKECTEWQTIDVPSEIVDNLQRRNQLHFGQAHGTPFTISPLSDDLGFQGDRIASYDILNGQYDTHGLQDNVATLIHHLKQTDEMAAIETYPTISDDEFIGKLKVWTESTTTSPSGLHLGHFKALIARHKYSGEPSEYETEEEASKREEFNRMQRELRRIHLLLINYALERGYSFQRWKTVANTILFKDPGCIRIHRTRIIHIYEADYNLILGLKWRIALYQSEALSQLNNGQYGSRPNRNAIDPVLIEELQLELSRVTRKTMLQTNYDASACYDRIIPNLAMIASRKFGVPLPVTQLNAATLQGATYHVRTDLGLAPTGYSHCNDHPIYGTGQGSGNSPAIWTFVSSIMFDGYDKLSTPALYCCPDGSGQTKVSMVGFVDDCNGQVNQFMQDETTETPRSIVKAATANAQIWTDLLGASGGALELSKCSYHLLSWQFSFTGAPILLNQKDSIPPVQVRDPHSQELCTLEYLPPYTAHKTLGHHKDPAGTQKEQFRKLKAKSDENTKFLWQTKLTREEAWTYYFACYLPSIGYPLTGSYFSRDELSTIQRHAMSIIIARCGYNRHTKRDIIYGPLELGGANFRHLYVEQGLGQVKYILKHWRLQSPAGQLLKCLMHWIQLAVGVSYPILSEVHPPLPHLESKWIASVRIFLSSINASIELDDSGIPQLQCMNDLYIMDQIIQSQQFTPAEIKKLNYCRLYLQAVTLADLVKTDGQSLDNAKLHGHYCLMSNHNRLLPINQARPSDSTWKLWKKANLIWSSLDGRLRQPLGNWKVPISQLRQLHFAYSYDDKIIIRVRDFQFSICKRSTNNTYEDTFWRIQFQDVPNTAIPVEVQSSNDNSWHIVHHESPLPVMQIPAHIANFTTFEEFIASLPPWEVELLQYTELSLDPVEFCMVINALGFKAASDGSVRHETQAAFGWTISTTQGERIATGKGPANGYRPMSYRAEAYGLLSILRFVIRIAEFTGHTEAWKDSLTGELIDWWGTLATDGLSVLQTLRGQSDDCIQPQEPIIFIPKKEVELDVLCPDWDVLREIQVSMKQLPQVNLQYVKGHQDESTAVARLPLLAQLNVEADAIAGEFQDSYGSDRPFVMMMTHTKAQFTTRHGTVTRQYEATIRREATYAPLFDHIRKKNGWSNPAAHSINWKAHGQALRSQIKHRSHFTKLVHEDLPTVSQSNRFKSETRTCPLCSCSHEDRDHILTCPHPKRILWREEFLTNVSKFCTAKGTYPPIRILLHQAITQWFNDPLQDFQVDPRTYPQELHSIIRQQNSIGWRQVFNGRFSKAWASLQDLHYSRERNSLPPSLKKMTGTAWQSQLIRHVWNAWYTLWISRNSDLHGYDNATRQAAERRELERAVGNIYTQRHLLEPRVEQLLYPEVQDHIVHPTSRLRNWLSTVTPLMQESQRRERIRMTRGVMSIRPFLTRREPTT